MIKRLLFLGFAGGLGLATARAQVAPAALTASPYRQNFDVLATTGTTNAKTTLPAGWDFTETGTSALVDNLYAADNGAANGGNTYSYGATSDTDRALGSLLSGTLTATIGAGFTNSTSAAITDPRIAYTGETWRIGGTTRADTLRFQVSTNATSLSTGTWSNVRALSYYNVAVATAVTTGQTAPIQTAAIAGTLTGVTIAPGATVWVRWLDTNAAGSDDGMAVDDFSLSWGAVSPTTSLALSTSALVFGGQNLGTTSAAQTYSLTATQLTGDVTVTATGPFTVSKDNAAFSTTLTLTAAELSAAKPLYVKFSPTASGTATGSITHASAGAASAVLTLTGTGVDPAQTTFNFNTCTTNGLSDGWLQYSVTGPQTWGCTTFGRDPAAPTGTAAYPNGVQINGYAGGNIENEDWFISPGFNLSTYTYPLFSFWSRTAFNGPGLKLRVSTNYSGSGAPSVATWTDLNVRFPENGSDTWTESPNFNLAVYKGAKVYLAFVYTSSTSAAARWTLDDISLTNSTTPPAPTLFADVKQVAFGYQAINTNGDRPLSVSANDLTGDITLTSSNAAFTLSKDGTTFASTLTLTRAEANGAAKTVTVRFRPTQASTAITGTITATTPGAAASTTVAVAGDTYDPAKTLEVVNWNIEWFGSADPTLGPTNKDLQKTNVSTVLNFLKADVYALAEVVDTVRLKAVVAQLSTTLGVPYAYKISEFGSYADNPQDVDYAGDQKLTFIYRTDMVKNPAFLGLLRCSQADNCPAYTPWASGRFPYLMSADVTLDGVTKRINFIVIHAKANAAATSANDYARRATGAMLLKNLLDTSYANGNTLLVGDYNDVLNGTIATGVTPAVSSYSVFLNDANYVPISLPLAQAGLRSTASFPTVIDNVIANKNMAQYYINGTASVRTDAAALVANYASTTSDHYPVFTRYSFANVLATKAARTASLGLYPNPVTSAVRFEVPETGANLTLDVHTVDGRLVLRGTGSVEQLNQQLSQRVASLGSGLYLIRVVGAQQTYTDRFVKQ